MSRIRKLTCEEFSSFAHWFCKESPHDIRSPDYIRRPHLDMGIFSWFTTCRLVLRMTATSPGFIRKSRMNMSMQPAKPSDVKVWVSFQRVELTLHMSPNFRSLQKSMPSQSLMPIIWQGLTKRCFCTCNEPLLSISIVKTISSFLFSASIMLKAHMVKTLWESGGTV